MKKTILNVLVFVLVFSFTVTSAFAFTPPGLSKKGGLPPGIQKRFIVKPEKDHAYETVIKDINLNEKRIVIQEGTALIHLLVDNNAKIELNGKKSTLKELQINDKIVIKTNSSNTITEIKATGGNRTVPQETKVTGVIKIIDLSKKELIIEANKSTTLYKLQNTTVYIDNKLVTMQDLKVGMEVTAHVNGYEIKTIYAKPLAVKEIEATIKAIDVSKREIVLQYDKKEELYKIKADAVVKVNGVIQNLSSIKTGMVAKVKIQANEITEITVDDGILQLEGRLMAKNTGTTPTITVQINQELKTYNVKKDLSMTHVNVGNQIVVYIKDNIVVALHEKNK